MTSALSDNISQNFINRMESKKAIIAVIGLGYVGLPLMIGYHQHGFAVLGLDIDESKVNSLYQGKSYFKSITWSKDNLAGYDAILVATKHSSVPYEDMTRHAKLVIDTRNISKNFPDDLKKKVVKA